MAVVFAGPDWGASGVAAVVIFLAGLAVAAIFGLVVSWGPRLARESFFWVCVIGTGVFVAGACAALLLYRRAGISDGRLWLGPIIAGLVGAVAGVLFRLATR